MVLARVGIALMLVGAAMIVIGRRPGRLSFEEQGTGG
jgi:hypothetical protein